MYSAELLRNRTNAIDRFFYDIRKIDWYFIPLEIVLKL